jgi:hypothetical protein
MARRPVSDIRSVVGRSARGGKVERFFVVEIARFLRAQRGAVHRYLRQQGLLRIWRKATRPAQGWTTARGCALAIAHFRAIQGQQYARGNDLIRNSDRMKALRERRKRLGT